MKRWFRSGKIYDSRAKAIAEAEWLDKNKRSKYEHRVKVKKSG